MRFGKEINTLQLRRIPVLCEELKLFVEEYSQP